MSVEIVLQHLDACKSSLEPYMSYGAQVTDVVEGIDKIKALLANPTPANINEALTKCQEYCEMFEQYQSYVPDTCATIKAATAELEKMK